jgi:hypothetical protein
MDREVIYRKTAKGQEEMATRAYQLSSRERSILVLVDGKRTGAELIDKSLHFGNSEAYLDSMLAAGFIEVATVETPAAPTSIPPRPAPSHEPSVLPARPKPPIAAPTVSSNTMVETANFARHFLLRILGPDGDELAARIESSRNLRDLTLALTRGRDALQALIGRRKAEEFWHGVRERLPQVPPFTDQ